MPVLLPHQFLQQPQGPVLADKSSYLGADLQFLWTGSYNWRGVRPAVDWAIQNGGLDLTQVAVRPTARGITLGNSTQNFARPYYTPTKAFYVADQTPFTFGVLVRLSKTATNGNRGSIIVTGPGASLYTIEYNDNKTISFRFQTTFSGGTTLDITSAATYEPGAWLSLVGVMRTPGARAYINGQALPSTVDPVWKTSSPQTSVNLNLNTSDMLIAFVSTKEWNESDALSWHNNPWQLFQPQRRQFFALISDVIVRPSSDVTTTGWVAYPDPPLYAKIDEVTPDDADYITSPDLNSTPGPAVFGISASLPAGSYDVRFRARRTASSGQARVSLLDSSNVVQGTSGWVTLTGSFAQYTASVTTTGTAVRVRIEVQP